MTTALGKLTRIAVVVVAAGVLFVGCQAVQTLFVLDRVERERDTWQRPDDIIRALQLKPGDTVVDFGSGAGYFTLRLAPVVGRGGRVYAVDIRRESLAFLTTRALLRREWQIDAIVSEERNPRLPSGAVDAVLIVNTLHEVSARAEILRALFQPLKTGGRLVVADRRHRSEPGVPPHENTGDHAIEPDIAAAEIREAGFAAVARDDGFIDRAGDDPWYLLVFRKP